MFTTFLCAPKTLLGIQNSFNFANNVILDSTSDPIKCLTPHILEAERILSGELTPSSFSDQIVDDQTIESIRENAASLLETINVLTDVNIQNYENYISPSGKFRLNFTRTGNDAVPATDSNGNGIPDYIELAAAYADSGYRYMVQTLGYVDPVLPGIPYEIRFRQINAYGFTQSAGLTSFIVVHRNFAGFPPNDDPDGNQLGALKVTIAHELKHAIQYATTRWQGESGTVNWIEMDATMMEEVVFPTVNDYINYLNVCSVNVCSIIRNPNRSTPGSYYHATWMLYYSYRFGPEFWVDVWDILRLKVLTERMTGAMRTVLTRYGSSFHEEFTRNHLWHTMSGPDAISGYGFSDAHLFPTARKTEVQNPDTHSMTDLEPSRPRAAQYLQFQNPLQSRGSLSLISTFERDTVGVGIVARMSDGTYQEYISVTEHRSSNGNLRVTPPFDLSRVSRFDVAISNAGDRENNIGYELQFRVLPSTVTAEPAFPNPFTHSTTIPFSVPEDTHVTLKLYDTNGRLIRTLIDRPLVSGFYDVRLDGEGLSSGLYLYTLITGTGNQSGKLIRIR